MAARKRAVVQRTARGGAGETRRDGGRGAPVSLATRMLAARRNPYSAGGLYNVRDPFGTGGSRSH